MTDENDVETLLDEHGIVTEDDLQNAIDDALGKIDTPDIDLPDDMPDEFDSFVDERGAAEVADQRVVEHFDHLVNEDCDTERCNTIRDQLGLDPDGDDHDHDEEAPAVDGEADEADAGEAEDAETTETGEGGAHRGGQPDDAGNSDSDTDSDGSEDTSTTTQTDESEPSDDTDDDGGEDVETNVFGEPV